MVQPDELTRNEPLLWSAWVTPIALASYRGHSAIVGVLKAHAGV